jgi:hypothetical protein
MSGQNYIIDKGYNFFEGNIKEFIDYKELEKITLACKRVGYFKIHSS